MKTVLNIKMNKDLSILRKCYKSVHFQNLLHNFD